MSCEHGLTTKECYVCMSPKHGEPAKKREWVGLTKDEMDDCECGTYYQTCKALEAKLKEKNT